jgi:N-acylneuraminate cytidylyltransferase/CMP-N,N'-diacetyllegionaminic acid synthase
MEGKTKKAVLGIIPARGGSKGVPRKNIKELAGKPLIVWTIETALASSCLDRIIVSTDDPDIAKIAREYSVEVPFLRPRELSRDDTSDMPVYQHALFWLHKRESYRPEIIAWLRPTSPLRTSEDIDGAVNHLLHTDADWVRSVCLAEHHPYWMVRIKEGRLSPFQEGIDIGKYIRRQLLPQVYRINGAVDAAWWKTIMEKGLLYSGDVRGYIMPQERSIDLDSSWDFALAEFLLKRRNSD